MNILVNKNNVVFFVGDIIEYGVFDESFEKWRITKDDFVYYAIDDNFTRLEISNEDIPNECEVKYCYTENDGFYLNPDYVEPYNIETEVKRLTTENEELKTKIINLENSTVEGELETDFRLSMLELGLS